MSRNKRLSILTAAEVEDLYGVPSFNESYQRFYFMLNDKELAEISRIRQRKYRCVAIALLGYFKCKPVLLNPRYKSMQDDLVFIARFHYRDLTFRRFSLNLTKNPVSMRVFYRSSASATGTIKDISHSLSSTCVPVLKAGWSPEQSLTLQSNIWLARKSQFPPIVRCRRSSVRLLASTRNDCMTRSTPLAAKVYQLCCSHWFPVKASLHSSNYARAPAILPAPSCKKK